MNLPDHTLLFTGFCLAHAAYSLSDLPEGDLLIPLMIIENHGKREVIRFQADTQVDAINQGKEKIEQVKDKVDLWTFSREGTMTSDAGEKVDAISIDGGSIDSDSVLTVVLPFRPFHIENKFKVYNSMLILVDGELVDSNLVEEFQRKIEEGISGHPEVKNQWKEWIK